MKFRIQISCTFLSFLTYVEIFLTKIIWNLNTCIRRTWLMYLKDRICMWDKFRGCQIGRADRVPTSQRLGFKILNCGLWLNVKCNFWQLDFGTYLCILIIVNWHRYIERTSPFINVKSEKLSSMFIFIWNIVDLLTETSLWIN